MSRDLKIAIKAGLISSATAFGIVTLLWIFVFPDSMKFAYVFSISVGVIFGVGILFGFYLTGKFDRK